MKSKESITFRISFNCTPEEYAEFNKLKEKHGLKTNTIFTKLFHRSLELMREKPTLWEDIV